MSKHSTEGVTFFTGLPGYHLVELLIAHADRDLARHAEARTALLAAANEALTLAPGECEMLYGRAGALYALLFAHVHGSARVELADVEPFVQQILAAGRSHGGSSLPLNYAWHEKMYLGGAHGLAGILTTLLVAHRMLPGSLPSADLATVFATVDTLAALHLANGNMPTRDGSRSEDLVHWCHGAPATTLLLVQAALAAQPTDPSRATHWLATAAEYAEVVWQRGLLKKGVGLCHGISGNAYAFLALYRATKDPLYLFKAKYFATFALDHLAELRDTPDHPRSLFEGHAGLAVLCSDLADPEHSFMPGGEL